MKSSLILISFLLHGATLLANNLDSLKQLLDKEISQKSNYQSKKQLRINAIKSLYHEAASGSEEWLKLNTRLGKEYEKFCYDSALFYHEKNLEYARNSYNKKIENGALLEIGFNLANVGRSKEAEDILNQIDTALLADNELIKFFDIERKLYELSGYYASLGYSWWTYKNEYNKYKKRLTKLLDRESAIMLAIKEKDLLDERELQKSLEVNTQRLEKVKIGDPEYSLITFQRSLIYELMGDSMKRKKYLMLSAISDIRSANRDNASLMTLASILYKEGNIEDAYFYIQGSYDDATLFKSDLRFQEIAKILSPIAKSYEELAAKQEYKLRTNFYIISLLLLVLSLTVILVIVQLLKLKNTRDNLKQSLEQLNASNKELQLLYNKKDQLNQQLSDSNIVKEHYIGNFLNIQADYIDKLDKYQKMVKKMLVGKKHDKLIEQINTGQFINAEIKSFYETFDRAFLSIYPNFIEELNKLVRDDEKIALASDELMNTEVRIFALIRLGIEDSSTIAKVLRYSVNTIYNYRVKLKNKAKVDRDEFENLVKNIGTL